MMQLRRWKMRKQMGLDICSKKLLWIAHGLQPLNHIYKFNKFVCDEGFGGWGKGEAGEAAGDFFS
jgi:hypothetical protein